MRTFYKSCFTVPVIAALFLLLTHAAFAQSKEWVYLKGEVSANGIGIYGTKGVESTTNMPGTRQGAITWKDLNGNLWLFGGDGYASTSTKGSMNDLWMFNINTRNWVWVSGDKTVNATGVYGTKKTAAAANKPGGRYCGNGFRDAAGNLYLFGGIGYNSGTTIGFLNDLWKFDMTTKQWTWMSGEDAISKTGVYGTKGTAAAANQPGGRRQAGGTTDKDGNFWLFGGWGYPATGTSSAPIGDLWKYTVSTGMWTWVSGDNTLFVSGVYGTKGTAAAANKPGGRSQMNIWTDGGTNVFVFGGYNSGRLNDVWKYNTTTSQWTWMNGSNTIDALGVYDTQGTENTTNMPGARYDYSIAQDYYGNPYIFGGVTKLASGNDYQGDIWKYNNANNRWTWVSGTAAGRNLTVSGTKGTSAPANQPSGRYGSAAWFTGGNLWILGGNGYTTTTTSGYLNDMWGYVPSGGFAMFSLPVRFEAFTAQKQGNTTLLNWSTAQESNSAYFAVERSLHGTIYDSIGKVGAAGNSSVTNRYSFTDRTVLPGTTHYRLKQVDMDGRAMYSKVITVGREEGGAVLTVLGNPIQHTLKLLVELPVAQPLSVQVLNAQGIVLITTQQLFSKGKNYYSIPLAHQVPGTYYVVVAGQDVNTSSSFMIQRR